MLPFSCEIFIIAERLPVSSRRIYIYHVYPRGGYLSFSCGNIILREMFYRFSRYKQATDTCRPTLPCQV